MVIPPAIMFSIITVAGLYTLGFVLALHLGGCKKTWYTRSVVPLQLSQLTFELGCQILPAIIFGIAADSIVVGLVLLALASAIFWGIYILARNSYKKDISDAEFDVIEGWGGFHKPRW